MVQHENSGILLLFSIFDLQGARQYFVCGTWASKSSCMLALCRSFDTGRRFASP
jgi:hypothetical protein